MLASSKQWELGRHQAGEGTRRRLRNDPFRNLPMIEGFQPVVVISIHRLNAKDAVDLSENIEWEKTLPPHRQFAKFRSETV